MWKFWMDEKRKENDRRDSSWWLIHCFKIIFPSWILVLLFSNLFFSYLIFPQLWQYSWSQMWVHFLKMPAVEAGKQVGENDQRNLSSLGQRQKTHQYCTNRTAGTLIEKIKLQVRKQFTFLFWTCPNGLLPSFQNTRKHPTA